MAVELATAYIALVPSLKGASSKIKQELGSIDTGPVGSDMGRKMGSSMAGSMKSIIGPAIAVLGSGMFAGFIADAAKASDATDKFKATMSFAGMDNTAITNATKAAKDYADQTVYDLPTIQNMTAQLASNGVKDYTGLTQAAGNLNAVAGGNADTFKSVAMVMTQTAGAGKLTTENWNQMADAIPGAAGPLMKALEGAGAYTGNFRDAMAAGQITSDEFNAALQKLGTDPVAVEAAKSTKTFEGSIGNLQATINSGLMGALNALKPAITGAINGLAGGLGAIFKAFGAIFNLFKSGDFTGEIGKALGVEEDSRIVGVILTIRGGIVAMFAAFKAGGDDVTSSGFAGFMERIGLAAREVTGGIKAFFAAFKAGGDDITSSGFAGFLEGLGLKARKGYDAAAEAAGVFLNGIKTGSNTAEGGIDGLAAKIGNGIHGAFATAQGGASSFWDGLTTGSGTAAGGLDGFAATAGNGLRGMFGSVKSALSGIDFGTIFGGLAATFGPLIPQIATLASAFSPMQIIFKSIAPLLPQLLDVFVQLATVVGGTLSTALTTLLPVFMEMQGVFVSLFQQVLAAVLPVIVQLVTMLGQTFAQLLPVLLPIIVQVASLAMTLVSQLAPIFMQLVSTVLPMVVTIFGAILGAILPLITMLAALLIPIIQMLMPIVVMVFGVIATVIGTVMQIVMGIIQVVTGIISGNWSQVWNGILNIFGGIWNTIVAVVGGVLAVLGTIISGALSGVAGFIGSILGNIGKFFADTWNNITNGISSFVGGIGSFFAGIPGAIMGALSGAGSWLFNVGKDIVNGLISGVQSMMGAIGNAILSLIPGPIVGVFKDALGIQSPSRVFRGFGKNIVEGLILGTGDKAGDLSMTMRGLVTVPDAPAFSSAMAVAGSSGAAMSPSFNVYVGNEQLDARTYRVASSAISSADSNSQYMRRGR